MLQKTINCSSSKKWKLKFYCSSFDDKNKSVSILSLLHGSVNCHEAQIVALILLFHVNDPSLPTCRRSVKRISVNFALLCLSDIMNKILKESQFTVESESHGERFLLILDASKMGSWLIDH